MAAIDSCTISGQQIEFTPFIGIIEDVQNWSTTQVWAEGGGGYVHPRFGGYVEAPSVRSKSTHHIRVRVVWEGGRKTSIDLPGHIQFCRGDMVIFVSGENKLTKVWQWVGVINITTECSNVVGELGDLAKINAEGYFEHVGVFSFSVTQGAGGGQRGGQTLIVVGGILCLLVTIPLNYMFSEFWMAFWTSVGIVAPSLIIGTKKLISKIRKHEREYHSVRVEVLQKALKRGLTLPKPSLGVEAAPA